MVILILQQALPVITHIINCSLHFGTFPEAWLKAFVLPLPKVQSPNLLKDFRPISILPFLSKILEAVVHHQLSKFIFQNNLITPFQSGFRLGHSTTTALLKITDDVREGMENTKLTVLVLVDFSNAFNTVNHDILLALLSHLGVSTSVTNWFKTYLRGRQQAVRVNGSISDWCDLEAGVPQGGILSPLLFSIFINFITTNFKCSYHLYADDLQLYSQAGIDGIAEAIGLVNDDLQHIFNWATTFGVAINPGKCQAIVLGSPRQLGRVDLNNIDPVLFNNSSIPFYSKVKNLGLVIDSTFTCFYLIINNTLFFVTAIALCAYAAEVEKKKESEPAELADNKDKRQTQQEYVPGVQYRVPRKQKAAPVQEQQEDDRNVRTDSEEYRPGQVFSVNAQELLELQPERKAPLSGNQLLQQLYSPQQDQKEAPQQYYYLEPQTARQVAYQPSHAVIARPHYTANGGEASVGAALSVSDSGASSSDTFDQELLALLSHSQVRTEEPRQQASQQSVAPQYQQVDRYITKPSKKPSKLRPKVTSLTSSQPLPAGAPQQYLIETTNVQQQQQQAQQPQVQYRPASQPQRPVQSLRYVPIQPAQPAVQQILYERPESQGLKVVPAPKLVQQPRQQQVTYRFLPQYQQPEATPKQYRIIDTPRPLSSRPEQRIPSSAERQVTYLKRYPEPEKNRAVKIYDPSVSELAVGQQSPQVVGEQYYLRPVYRTNEQRVRYESAVPASSAEQPRIPSPTKAPHSAIYVSKNVGQKKPRPFPIRPDEPIHAEHSLREQHRSDYSSRLEHAGRIEQTARLQASKAEQVARAQQAVHIEQAARAEQVARAQQAAQVEQAARAQAAEQVSIEQYGQNIDDQRVQLPPPKNNKAYTPEEFAALVAAGYAVTPIPVSALNQQAQSRSSEEEVQVPQIKHRPIYRRPQYLPIRGDDAP
ncbi:uncharacterized protein ACR2FA_003780 [Aphomia sociella]